MNRFYPLFSLVLMSISQNFWNAWYAYLDRLYAEGQYALYLYWMTVGPK